MLNLYNDFVKKYKGKIVEHYPIKYYYALYRKKARNSIRFKEKSNESNVLKSIYILFHKYFWKNEVLKSFKYTIISPFLMKENNNPYLGCPWKIPQKKKEVNLAITFCFAIYSKKKKEFIWTNINSVRDLASPWFEKAKFANNQIIKNITEDDADYLAMWYRVSFYDKQMIYTYNSANKKMKTNNLVKFAFEPTKNDWYIIYTLTDLGFKDPPYNKKMSSDIGIFHLLFTAMSSKNKNKRITNKSRKSRKSRRRSKIRRRSNLKNDYSQISSTSHVVSHG